MVHTLQKAEPFIKILKNQSKFSEIPRHVNKVKSRIQLQLQLTKEINKLIC